MRVFRGLAELTGPLPAPVLTIGNFDGVHLGHQRLFQTVAARAREIGGTAAALTFEPHPAKILRPERAAPLLTTLEQKLALLEAAGLDAVVVVPFTIELSQLTPREFIQNIVVGRLGARRVCVGGNFRFGHRQAGDVAALEELGRELGFEVEVIPPVVVRGETASSSLIRRLVAEGKVSQAARLLGRPYVLAGALVRGEGRGRTLGFPTLNLAPEQECLPARGVYVTETLLDARAHPSATNVGIRPTFDGSRLVVESHLFDFHETVERGRLEVRFHERLRPEKKFAGPEALRAQIARDVEKARRFFAQRAQCEVQRARKLKAAS